MSNDYDNPSLLLLPSTQDHIQGVLNAAVMVVMYGDYQCSQSADVYRLIKVMQRQLSAWFGADYLGFIFRHFPQHPIHPQAQRAAEAAEAAATQGQFWQMHEMLFDRQSALGNGYLIEYANELELDISRFLQDLSKQVHNSRINEDIASAYQSGVTVAPALFINGIRYSDRWNIQQLREAIASANDSVQAKTNQENRQEKR